MPTAPVPDDPARFIRQCLMEGHIRWTYHVTMRLQQRALRAELLLAGVDSLEILESYPDDKYLPSFLLRAETEGTIFHVQIATDVNGGNVRIVTMYLPDPATWDERLRSRRKQL